MVPIPIPIMTAIRATFTQIAHDSPANVNGNIKKIIIPTIIAIIFNPICSRWRNHPGSNMRNRMFARIVAARDRSIAQNTLE